MALTDQNAFHELLSRLDRGQSDDVPVATLAARRIDDTRWSLLYGSILLGPAGMAASSWLDWRAASGDAAAAVLRSLFAQQGVALSDFADFAAADADWLIARRPLAGAGSPSDRVARWIKELTGPGAAFRLPDDTPALVTAVLEPADALAMSSPWRSSDLQPLIVGAARPVHGYRFPNTASPDPAPEPPASWPAGTTVISQPMLNLLGLGRSSRGTTPAPALAVGRLRRTAWFSGLRQSRHIEATVTLGAQQASLGDLEIDLEEYAKDGLVHARRLRLADLALPESQQDHVVLLPTLGPGLRHQLRLYDLAGRLLDTCEVDAFAQQLSITMTAQVGPETVTHEATVGQPPAPASPVTRLADLDAAEAAYTRLLTEGLDRRILDDVNTAPGILEDNLRDAREELLILDPYYGHKPADWQILAKVTVPVRVLTRHKETATAARTGVPVAAPDQASVQHLPQLHVRSWSQTAPWHDRVYLWTGGGLTVGGSPSGLGKRLMRIDRLSPVEAQDWRTRFDTWWQDQRAIQVR